MAEQCCLTDAEKLLDLAQQMCTVPYMTSAAKQHPAEQNAAARHGCLEQAPPVAVVAAVALYLLAAIVAEPGAKQVAEQCFAVKSAFASLTPHILTVGPDHALATPLAAAVWLFSPRAPAMWWLWRGGHGDLGNGRAVQRRDAPHR